MQNGFVYLWRDKQKNLYYIGSHWGTEDDGYTGSNDRLRLTLAKRPTDLRRRIIYRHHGDYASLLIEEQKFLDLAAKTPKRYLNFKFHASGGNGCKTHNRNAPAWNKGMTKDQMKTHQPIMKVAGRLVRPVLNKVCHLCGDEFITKRLGQKFCGLSCSGKHAQSFAETSGFQKGKPSWNRGIANPRSAEIGRSSAAKQSATVKGRKRAYREDGTWYWSYPKNREPLPDKAQSSLQEFFSE